MTMGDSESEATATKNDPNLTNGEIKDRSRSSTPTSGSLEEKLTLSVNGTDKRNLSPSLRRAESNRGSTSSFRDTFPQKPQKSPETMSLNASSTSSPAVECKLFTPEKINEELSSAGRYAFADLVASVLQLDFWNEDDPSMIFYCKTTFQTLIQTMSIPEKAVRGLKAHLEGEEQIGDVADLILAIKKERLVNESGTISLMSSLLFSFVNSGNYDSRDRVLLRHIGTLLAVVWEEFEDVEDSLASTILNYQFVESERSKQAREKLQKQKKLKRYLMIGAASGVGGVLIGLTGGLAAPLVAGSIGVLIGSGALAGLATTAGAAVLGTTFGVAGAGLAGYKMKKRVGAIEEFAVETLTDGSGLHCTLVVSGWIDRDTSFEEAFIHQWRHLVHSREQYTLRYESQYLRKLGSAIDYLMGFAVSMGIQQTLMGTALAGLVSAVAWPVALISASSVLDNPWNVCVARAAEVGEHLAEVLLSRAHGKRPISLVGFSLGARVIYHCLLAMSQRAESAGIIEDVILLGAPVTASPTQWRKVCSVVGGRVINGYCETDWLLRLEFF
ncbi:hypothetical protein WR25_08779 isoform D [Diploscapter pachys]|uniref:DUF726 domain-containing protein n=2 Tax=Diploscapter pachys TaxID=2018661 RepID=A0A2A2KP99_9BILA|nr:hypothetical protein WR25_08779 isoform D [Diploscapter pachys]